jgi:hypothetical protein
VTFNCQGDVTFTIGRNAPAISTYSLNQGHDSFRSLGQAVANDKGRIKGQLRVDNPRYSFGLARNAPDAPWALIKVEKPVPVDGTHVPHSAKALIRLAIDHAISIEATPNIALPELLRESDFGIRQASNIDSVTPLVRWQFEWPMRWFDARVVNGIEVGRVWNGIRKGWVDVDPRMLWVVRAYDVEYQEPNGKVYFVSGRYDYENLENDSSQAAPRLTQTIRRSRAGSDDQSETLSIYTESRRWDKLAPPDSEFTLTHYGFLEPAWVVPPASCRAWWIAGAGIACLVVGAVVSRRYRNRPREAGTSSAARRG